MHYSWIAKYSYHEMHCVLNHCFFLLSALFLFVTAENQQDNIIIKFAKGAKNKKIKDGKTLFT